MFHSRYVALLALLALLAPAHADSSHHAEVPQICPKLWDYSEQPVFVCPKPVYFCPKRADFCPKRADFCPKPADFFGRFFVVDKLPDFF